MAATQRALGAFEIRGRVHIGQRPLDGERHADLHAVLERAQLFELLDLLEPSGRQTREPAQRRHAIRVDADVPQACAATAIVGASRFKGIGAREKYSARPVGIAGHLHDVGIGKVR